MKIAVVGLGYVGLSNAVLLAQHNDVIGVDLCRHRVEAVNNRRAPITDEELSNYLRSKELSLKATTDLSLAINGANFVVVATPTNYNEEMNSFDTSSVEKVIEKVVGLNSAACIVIRSTIPIGFVDSIRSKFSTDAVIFSPEFLREGRALLDNLHPSRIIVGERSSRAETFAQLLCQGAVKTEIEVLFTGTREAEAIKLFANTYLAMRVAFFNELDSFTLKNNMSSREVIDGISMDPRVGSEYNNPSFGYGGYCLPKDTKQLLANYSTTPQKLMEAIVSSNATRKKLLSDEIIGKGAKTVGIFKLAMKSGSDNFRESAILDILNHLRQKEIKVIIYEPSCKNSHLFDCLVENKLALFKQRSDLVITNRYSNELDDIRGKVFTRDIYGNN